MLAKKSAHATVDGRANGSASIDLIETTVTLLYGLVGFMMKNLIFLFHFSIQLCICASPLQKKDEDKSF